MEEHVATCEACAGEAARLRQMWEALGELPEEKPSPALRARFYAMLEQAKADADVPERRPLGVAAREGWARVGWPRWLVPQFGVAVLLLVVGFAVGRGFRPADRPTGEVEALRAEVAGMQQVMSMALFTQFSSADRLLAIQLMSRGDRLDEPVLGALLKTVESDPSVNVRLAAVDALSGFLERSKAPDPIRLELARALENQTSPMVQISLVDALAEGRDPVSLGALRNLAADAEVHPDVRQHAQQRIEGAL
jgi:hypothetical protein